MKNIQILLLLIIASFSMNSFAMNGRHTQKMVLNVGGIIAANLAANITYAEGENKPEHAPDYIDSKKYPTWAKFVAKYRCSPEIEKLVKENPKKTRVKGFDYRIVYKYDEIPFYNKGENFDRIANAEILKETIKENNLDHLSVPDKCVCQMYGTAWSIIAKEAQKQKKPSNISLIQVQQMVKLIKKTGLMDMNDDNYFKSDHDTIMIIDTEFVHPNGSLTGLQTFRRWGKKIMAPEAYEWLNKQIEKEEAEEEAAKNSILTPFYKTLFSSFYNKKSDINLDQVRKEYLDYQIYNNEKTKP